MNIETDLIGKYVEKLMSVRGETRNGEQASRIDVDMLMRYGFET
ncbi:MAG: hypothetical protein U5R49_24700 [Deltaproteobacteria bacterium]|nr:hypothetical protein [Deltaproteobacteria bacterium]